MAFNGTNMKLTAQLHTLTVEKYFQYFILFLSIYLFIARGKCIATQGYMFNSHSIMLI